MNIDSKKCTICKTAKPIASFQRDCYKRDGRRSDCKKCCKNRKKEAGRTKLGLLRQRYHDMVKRAEGRDPKAVSAAGKPIISKDEFISWAMNNIDFHCQFRKWEESNYQLREAPSIDRIDPRFGYELFNIQFVSQSENSKRAAFFKHYDIIV